MPNAPRSNTHDLNFVLLAKAIAIAGLALVLAGCGAGASTSAGSSVANRGGGSGGGSTTTVSAPALPVNFNPPVGSPLLTTDTLTMTFPQAMNTVTATIAPAGGTWNAAATTYTVTGLTAGALNVSISAADATGARQVNLNNLSYNVYAPNAFVYVSPAGNDTNGTGSKTAPFATISHAISTAVPGQAVLVAGGTYAVDSGAGTNVVIRDGVSLYGGYASDFSSRNPAANVTTITDTATAAGTMGTTNFGTPRLNCVNGSAGAPMAAVSAGTLTGAVIMDGFTVNGSANASTVASAAVSINNGGSGALVLSNDRLNGGAGSAASVGVYSVAGTYYLVGDVVNGGSSAGMSLGVYHGVHTVNASYNSITGGSGAKNSVGVLNGDIGYPPNSTTNWDNLYVNLSNNVIAGGSGANSYGVYSVPNCPSYTFPDLVNNTISGGSGSVSSTAFHAQEYVITGAFRNIIDGGSGPVSIGIDLTDLAYSTDLYNNTISGGSGATSSTAISNTTGTIGPNGPVVVRTVVVNNILGTPNAPAGSTRVCYAGDASSSDPAVFANNDVSASCATALYSVASGSVTSVNAPTSINGAATTLAAAGNVSLSPVFVSATDWHLTSASPAELLQGGVDTTLQNYGGSYNVPLVDMDGIVITPVLTLNPGNPGAAGLSMGAYEKN